MISIMDNSNSNCKRCKSDQDCSNYSVDRRLPQDKQLNENDESFGGNDNPVLGRITSSAQESIPNFNRVSEGLATLQRFADEQNQVLKRLQVAQSSPSQWFTANSSAEMQKITETKGHFITITQNEGTILEATETITGFPPVSLLMKSLYDGVHPEDYMSLKCIKERYWATGNLQIQTYYRRKNILGNWMWVVGKLHTVMETPIRGLIIQERCPGDTETAEKINKLTSIAVSVVTAIDQSFSWNQLKNDLQFISQLRNIGSDDSSYNFGTCEPASAELRSFLDMTRNQEDSIPRATLQRIKQQPPQQPQYSVRSTLNNSILNPPISMDGFSSLVREGPCLRLCKINLCEDDSVAILKMIVLLLTGHLQIDNFAMCMLHPDNDGKNMNTFFEKYELTRQAQQHEYEDQITNLRRRRNQNSRTSASEAPSQVTMIHTPLESVVVPPISCINISHTNIGDDGMEQFCEILTACTPNLRTLDLGFCKIGEKGILVLCRALYKRRRKGLAGIQGLILSGNTISFKAAKELGNVLYPVTKPSVRTRRSSILFHHDGPRAGYDEDDEYGTDDDDDEEDNDVYQKNTISREKSKSTVESQLPNVSNGTKSVSYHMACDDDHGIKLLHLACTSMTGSSILELLLGLSQDCEIEELDISANHIGVEGLSHIVDFLEGNSSHKKKKGSIVMPKLTRINLSNNNLGNEGIAKLTRAISRRQEIGLVDLHLSFNGLESLGTGIIMNKLLHHNIVSLSLDNNLIGDSGCQLVAASLTSLHFLSKLNLSFNQIGCRGITSLMRALLGCETITSLSISGNIMKISGAMAMGYALAHHPRLAQLDVDNCCLSQVAQCHIAAGIISNRWVPMQTLNGFKIGPPLAAIGALDLVAQHLGNADCLALRRNIQMKANLDSMEAQKMSKANGSMQINQEMQSVDLSSVDFVTLNSCNGAPYQTAYYRLLDWLSRIPFDDDELDNLRRYFYDIEDESPDGLRGSDGRLNLKVRGDLLAALGSNLEKEMRENEKNIVYPDGPSLGLCLLPEDANSDDDDDEVMKSNTHSLWRTHSSTETLDSRKKRKVDVSVDDLTTTSSGIRNNSTAEVYSPKMEDVVKCAGQSRDSMSRGESYHSNTSTKRSTSLKARISMFPLFLEKLDLLKLNAQEMMDEESDPAQQDIIAEQFAEASLIMLRQLRYHCMNSGLDGWRQGKSRRKVLIVDDSVVTRKLVARAFEKANFIVDTAQNGEEGVSMMKDSIYDIAFMDIDMPVMNGFDATKALREWENSSRPGARQPICALTAAYVDDFEISELMKFKEAGLDVMESKPCNIPRLFKVVDDVSPMFSDLSISVTKHQGLA